MVELLWDAKFALWEFKLDCQHAFSMAPVIADVIGLKYGRLSFWAKTIFHTEQIKIMIPCLKMLTTQYCRHINEMQSQLKYIKGLEEIWAKEISILTAIYKQ